MTLLIGVPVRRSLPVEFARAVFALQLPGPVQIVLSEGYAVAAQRNQIVGEALQHPDVDAVLFLDDDMLVPPETVRRLLARQRGIVGALYYAQQPPFQPLAGRYDFAAADPYRHVTPGTGLQQVDYVGAGALLIRTAVLRDLPTGQWFQYGVEDHRGTQRMIMEDEWFCRAARQQGYAVFCDTDLVVPHLAALPIDARRATALRAAAGDAPP